MALAWSWLGGKWGEYTADSYLHRGIVILKKNRRSASSSAYSCIPAQLNQKLWKVSYMSTSDLLYFWHFGKLNQSIYVGVSISASADSYLTSRTWRIVTVIHFFLFHLFYSFNFLFFFQNFFSSPELFADSFFIFSQRRCLNYHNLEAWSEFQV